MTGSGSVIVALSVNCAFEIMFLGLLYKNSETLTGMQSLKGIFFVVTTAFVIYILVYRDIKSLKLSEDALIRSEKNYRHLVENAQEGIWNVDPRGKTIFVNGRMAEMLGYTIDEMMGVSMVLEQGFVHKFYYILHKNFKYGFSVHFFIDGP